MHKLLNADKGANELPVVGKTKNNFFKVFVQLW